jgi:hypothetical protein
VDIGVAGEGNISKFLAVIAVAASFGHAF